MGSEDGSAKRKEFQKRSDEDIDSFLAKSEFKASSSSTSSSGTGTTNTQKSSPPSTLPPPPPPDDDQPANVDHDQAIKMARDSRAEREAYHDVALLRKKAHAFGHKAAKFFRKHKAAEAAAHKCVAKAVAFREKATTRREKAKDFLEKAKTYEEELSDAAHGSSDLSPEALRAKIASTERKAAKEEEIARRYESKAASQTEKAAKFRSKSAKYLEQNKLNELESERFSKRADNLEKAGA